MNKNLICSLAITSIFLSFNNVHCSELETRLDTFKVKQSTLLSSHRLGNIDLYHDDEGFFVKRKDITQRINSYDIDPSLRNITNKGLENIEKLGGYISANEMDNSDITLRLNARGNGGGPVAGWIAYCVTKTLCYGTAVAATGAAVVATGGVAGAVVGTSATAATLGASTGASLVGGAIAGASLTAEAATVTTAVVTSTGTIAGAVTAVESLSAGVGAFFAALPIP